MEHHEDLEWLFDVEEIFDLSKIGIGFILAVAVEVLEKKLKVHDELVVKCVDGQIVTTVVKSFPFINTTQTRKMIPFEISRTDGIKHITKGAKVFRERQV